MCALHSLGEINHFLLNQEARGQGGRFVCWAKIAAFDVHNGWYYISCSKCCRKLGHNGSTSVCTHCGDPNAVGLIRFRVEVLVEDEEDIATFVLFDRHVAQLTGWTAAALLNAVGVVPNAAAIPQALLNSIDRIFKFEVKINHSIIVSSLLEEQHQDAGNP